MRHLFLAPLASAYGEALHGARIARALCAAGDEVVFVAPAAMHALVQPPVLFGRVDLALPKLDSELRDLLARMRCDSLVLVDAAAVGKVCRAFGLDVQAFVAPGVPVAALDCWDLPAEPVAWEYGEQTELLAPEFHALPRCVPVPIARPDAAGAFCALPTLGDRETGRDAMRAELGLGPADQLVVWPTASWQHAANHRDATLARRCDELPARVLPRIAALGPRVHLVHVGPLPFANAPPRYRHVAQLPPARYEALIAAADLLLCFNAAATSLATAIAASTPVVLAVGARQFAWPLALDRVLAPVLANNPLLGAVRHVDVADDLAFSAACRELLAHPGMLRDAQASYARTVRALPAGAEQLGALLGR